MITRRQLLAAALAAPILAACSSKEKQSSSTTASGATTSTSSNTSSSTNVAAATTLAPTPTCTDGDEPTIAETEGPYFKASSPEKSNLFADVSAGTKLVVAGTVLTTACQPVNRALIDVWQADDAGAYDNSGYTLRGHLFTDAKGAYEFTTVVPGLYPGRTRHIHIKVQAPNGPVLTTQLFFPDEAQNSSDSIFHKDLLLTDYKTANGGKAGVFGFVVEV
jgi:protocatechuate 3,4-dioxygenase beta subunit